MSAKHTPGPWRIDPKVYAGKDGGRHAYIEVSATTKAIWLAKVQTFSDDTGEYAANARLIAAAPELLHALKLWIESDFLLSFDSTLCVGCGEPKANQCGSDCSMEIGRRAIAKAEARNA